MSKEEFNIRKGCLPLLLIVFILFIIALVGIENSWASRLWPITEALYWIGVVYFLLILVISIFNKPEPIIVKSKTLVDEQKKIEKPIDKIDQFKEQKKIEDSKLWDAKNRWVSHHEYLILNNELVLDLLDENTIETISYSMLLSCFEWKFKRFKILVRDNFECQDCFEKSNELHVHHNYYLKNSLPWEIDDMALISLCRKCHNKRHEKEIIKVYEKFNDQLIVTNYHYIICSRCKGTGYLPQYKHVEDGICFQCHGNVISGTIFSDRLKTIKLNKDKYSIIAAKDSLKNFMSSISVEYFSKQINQKLFKLSNFNSDDLPF